MKKLLLVLVAAAIAVGLYASSAAMSLAGLAAAVRDKDAAAVAGRIDFPRVRQALVQQIVAAYLRRVGETRRVDTREQFLANTVGASIADAMLEKILAPQNLARLLHDGRVPADDVHPEIVVPRFGNLDLGNPWNALGRVRLVQPMEFAVRLSEPADDVYGIRMHFQGSGWRMSAIDLPPSVLRQIVDKLPRPGV